MQLNFSNLLIRSIDKEGHCIVRMWTGTMAINFAIFRITIAPDVDYYVAHATVNNIKSCHYCPLGETQFDSN